MGFSESLLIGNVWKIEVKKRQNNGTFLAISKKKNKNNANLMYGHTKCFEVFSYRRLLVFEHDVSGCALEFDVFSRGIPSKMDAVNHHSMGLSLIC